MTFYRALAIGLLVSALLLLPVTPVPTTYASGPIPVWGDYKLTSDITFSGMGFIVLADNITLNLDGHTITGSGVDFGVEVAARTGVTIKNGTITASDFPDPVGARSNIDFP